MENVAGKEEGAREEVQHQGAGGDLAHPLATIRKARPAGIVGRQWLGDNEWWGYRVDTGLVCSQGSGDAGTASLPRYRLHSPPWETESARGGSLGRPWAARSSIRTREDI